VENEIRFREAVRFWARLGVVSFGGPAGQIAIMQKELVDERKWIDHDDFLHALNFCMLLPGPEAQQLATYIGWKLHGYRGGIAAGTLFILPSVLILLLLSYVYVAFGSIPHVDAVLDGFKAVVVAIVIDAVIRLGGRSLKTYRHAAIASAAFALIFLFNVPFPLIVLGAAASGLLLLRNSNPAASKKSEPARPARPARPALAIIAVCALLWIAPAAFLLLTHGAGSRAAEVYLFFSKAAFVTFGGAYAVLAYVNQAAVASGWITSAQAIDGLALAETTPGPLIMVLQFIGFVAGWNASGSFAVAVVCGLAATWATFLPSFLFIFAGAPHVERLRSNRMLTAALGGVSAAVVGVILNLAIVFGDAVARPDGHFSAFTITLAAAAFIGLRTGKVNVLAIILAGGACGLAKYFAVG